MSYSIEKPLVAYALQQFDSHGQVDLGLPVTVEHGWQQLDAQTQSKQLPNLVPVSGY